MAVDRKRTLDIARDWKAAGYYDKAEQGEWVDVFWGSGTEFRRLFETLDRRVLIDLACGHGRHSARLLHDAGLKESIEKLHLLDINAENVKFCRERFSGNPSVQSYRNNGIDFRPIRTGAVTGIFCYDAMVHFELDSISSYLRDAFRVLAPGGRALFHHSNNESSPGADYREATQWRNFMSERLFAHLAIRAGFKVLEQVKIDVDNDASPGLPDRHLDCISLLERLEQPAWSAPTFMERATRKLRHLVSRAR
jgi:SAM-dependent methyltransferase